MYVQTDRSYQKCATYYCRPCGKEIQFQTQTCKKKVLRHESYKTHVQGLAKLRGTLVQAPSRAGVATAATGTSQACSGILASKHPLQQTITLFVQHGQPRMHYAKGETDPLEDIRFEVLSNDISIRHAKCKGVAGESMTACSECVQACKARTFKVAIAKQAYMIDLTMLTSRCYHSTAQELERFRAALPERDYQDARLALDLAALKNIAKKSLRTALDFQCFISVDTVPCELFADVHKWWTKDGKDLFRTPDAAATAFDLFDISPEAQEELEPPAVGAAKEQQAATEVLHQLQDRAQVIADIAAMERPQDHEAQNEEVMEVVPQQADVESRPEAVAEETADTVVSVVPTNLTNVLQAARVNGGDIFDLDSASASGQTAMLQRVLHMSGFLRSFIRHARAQEGLLSLATLNSKPAPLNSWNEREHMLAAARRAANVSQVRLSRAQAWQSSQERLATDVRPRNSVATDADPGLVPPTHYFPCGKDRFQIVAHLWGGQVCIGLILSAFRGALVRKQGSSETTVRTARPFPDDLPCTSTRMVRISACIFNPTTAEYATSCAELCMQLGTIQSNTVTLC